MYNVITEVASHHGIFKIYNYSQNIKGNIASFTVPHKNNTIYFDIWEDDNILVTMNKELTEKTSYIDVSKNDNTIASKVRIEDSFLYSYLPFILDLRNELLMPN